MKFSVLAVLFIAITSFEAMANNQYIPNYYRNRRTLNTGAALGWSERHEAGLQIKRSEEKTQEANVETQKNSLADTQAYLFHRLNENINLEGALSSSSREYKFSPPNSNNNYQT